MSIKGLERLDAWRKARGFALKIYREVLPLLPEEEKWGLNQQLRRACQSIPANIAEGYGRYYYQETIRFCYMARGSLEESLSHLSLLYELGFIPVELYTSLAQDGEEVSRLINGYIAYLKKTKTGAAEPGSIREFPELYRSDTENDDPSP